MRVRAAYACRSMSSSACAPPPRASRSPPGPLSSAASCVSGTASCVRRLPRASMRSPATRRPPCAVSSSGRRSPARSRCAHRHSCPARASRATITRRSMAGAPGVPHAVRTPAAAWHAPPESFREPMSTPFDPRDHRPAAAELAGRVVAITGASSGLGRAVALDCARHQARVVLIGRSPQKLETVHAAITAMGAPEPTIAVLDLEQALARDYDQLADALLERYARLDGLLHNAGILGTLTPIEHYDVPTWCRVLHVNVTAAF